MARAYSLDLRERVVGAAAGQTCRAVAKTLMVSVASVVKWSQRHRSVGSPAALKMGGRRPYLEARERDWVLSRIAESRTSRCALCLRSWPTAAWWSAITRFGIFSSMRDVQKSLRASEQDRPDVARRRERWKPVR
jgi:transposase